MSRRLILLSTVLSISVFGLTAMAATLVLDQLSPTAPAPAPFTWAVGGPVDQVLSQTVTAGVDGRLWSVRVPIGCESGELVLEIRDVDALGQPGATVRFSRSYDASDYATPVTEAYRSFRIIGRPVRLAAGDTYAIVLSNPTGSCGVWPGLEGDPYPGGNGWADANDGPIVPVSLGTGRDDLPFHAVMQAR